MNKNKFRAELVKITPGYWKNETSGKLRLAVEAYLAGGDMTGEQIAAIRAYLRQWISAPGWDESGQLNGLRSAVNILTCREQIDVWLALAEEIGIDPL